MVLVAVNGTIVQASFGFEEAGNKYQDAEQDSRPTALVKIDDTCNDK